MVHEFGVWRSWLAYASGGRVVASSSLVTPTMRKRRNKRLGFGLVNSVLALALVVATFVVTQTSALQYLKGKLAGGSQKSMMAAMAIPGNASSGDIKPLVTLKNAAKGRKHGQLLVKTGYVSYFNYEMNTPDWVAWELTSAEAKGRLDRKGFEFVPDDALPEANRVAFYDYKGTKYDRGHMCPAGDMKWSAAAMHDCFYMSNVCPQVRELNHVSWERLESACRRWAKRMGSIYIVCGPVYKNNVPEYIGVSHRVAVPDGFFKVVACLNKGKEKGIAFYYDNTDVSLPMRQAVRSIDQIEKMTKLDFFCELPDGIENRLESMRNLDDFEERPLPARRASSPIKGEEAGAVRRYIK